MLAKGNVSSLKIAGGLAMCMGTMRARAQIAACESSLDARGSLAVMGSGAGQELQTPEQMPLASEQHCQGHEASEATADQLYSRRCKLHEDLNIKRAELDAVLTSLEGMQQPASSSHINIYSDLLFQVPTCHLHAC